jgi:phenylacetate-CoA ligase
MRILLLMIYVHCFNVYRSIILRSPLLMKLMFIPGLNGIRNFSGKARAQKQFVRAKKKVPAYRSFLNIKKKSTLSLEKWRPSFADIPVMDKENYVQLYDMEARCVNGKIANRGVIIDESSGSSGTATNWVRGSFERKQNATMIAFGIQNLFGSGPLFIINAFAMGSWATGINISMSCVEFSKLKSPGPDKIKIENTLKHFGTTHQYVIMGYPPFLKMLVEQSEINWYAYNVSLVCGGESMSENMRDYLLAKGIHKVYSSFGASDLELNIAAENDFTISLRRLIRSSEALQQQLLKFTGALPMIFQYHPADFIIESSPEDELIITICRPGYLSPKIRYNIHDRGHVITLKELYLIMDMLKIDRKELLSPAIDLPLLFHYGRADMTVSFFGSNISPADIQEVIFLLPTLSQIVNSFHLTAHEDEEGSKKLEVSFELVKGVLVEETMRADFEKSFYITLEKINQDFREASRMAMEEDQKTIRFFEFGEGPFANNDSRIKCKYIS